MGSEETFKNIIHLLDNYDISKIRNLSDMVDLHNDKMELIKLDSVYSDYFSICNSPEFNRIRTKYCI